MMGKRMVYRILISVLIFCSAYLLLRFGLGPARRFYQRQVTAFDRVLRRQLLIDFDPKLAFWLSAAGVAAALLFGYALSSNLIVAVLLAAIAAAMPLLVVRHLESKRMTQLDHQLIDALTTIASGVRAGLTLTQAMELVVQNHRGPVQQEFAQLLREYQMGMDLNQAMRNAANRIGSPLYRLTFTAIEMHRVRGGDSGESLDRIASSIREIERLEGKLDALTSQGRHQAWMMAVMPLVFILMLWAIDPSGIALMFTEPLGRILLMIVVVMIGAAFLWIRKIMAIDI
ncbi:MAG: type II secretion system F family protein [Phycisphaeraceae bacterium]|nr:type II secretion system F family protein [Phycisphaeraceae bacterium]